MKDKMKEIKKEFEAPLAALTNKVTKSVLEECEPIIRDHVATVLAGVALAAKEAMEEIADIAEKDEPQEDRKPVAVEVRISGVDMDDDEQLEISKLVCDFLAKHAAAHGQEFVAEDEDGDEGDEEAGCDDCPLKGSCDIGGASEE